ncbi:unnamed protein product [Didymodactylos carnosus]|uniref:Uncharacterized protein n=1 Tax=Didymodactylos carnosus TaxID=1234261 RepID=A0A813X3F6_9BILA|nr:unnamed protein product [Didymodactylos carnosus]CAF1161533.1 unnamed protein product [Didymodactylos carnosus]CAF3650286.1 unnamed protein product [Didymodactylos carnosus]CAF3973225.1 unnamed protein product [Didymodactylos carnosus]
MKLTIISSLFIILAVLDLSRARTIRKINSGDNDNNEFFDDDNDNELTVNEDEGGVYRLHLSDAIIEQIFSRIQERSAKSIFGAGVIDDLNEFMVDKKNANQMIDLLFKGMSRTPLDPQIQSYALTIMARLTEEPILNAIQKNCSEIMVKMGDLQQKQKIAKCHPKLVAGIKQKIKEFKRRDPRPYKYQGEKHEFDEWLGKLFPVNA